MNSLETLRVLIVDDEEGMRLGATRALREFHVDIEDIDARVDFSVETAGTAEDALEMIEADCPDLLLLDHKLPGMTGLDLLKRIRKQAYETLTIMISAYASLETAIVATKRGAYDFLAKPFTPAELRNVVAKGARHLMVQRQAMKLASEKRQMRFQLTSVLAHELKSPLAALEGYLDLMDNRTAGEDLSAYDGMISRCRIRLEGMRKLIFDLLDMTRIESGQKKREFTDVDVLDVTNHSIENVALEAERHDITIRLDAPDTLVMDGDRGEVEIVLNNLVSNAVKYNRDGGSVDITLAADKETVTVTVVDTGIGMTDEEAGRLFEDFVRIRNSKTRNILGSGLGLSTVRKITRLYQGDIDVESQNDVGTQFTATLQRHSSPELPERPEHDDGQDGHTGLASDD